MNEKNLKPFKKGNQFAKGHGRPRIKEEVRAVKDANYWILYELVSSGKYSEIIIDVIEQQRKQSKIEALKFLSESVVGKNVVEPTSLLDDMVI